MDVAVRVTVTDRAGASVSRDVTVVERSRLALGMTAAPSDTALTVSTFPGVKYMRDFGSPETLTPQGTGKWLSLPANATMHVSWKGDVETLAAWMDGTSRPYWLTWWHEPMGDVTPATYRATCERMVAILDAHPKRSLCLGHGPIVTRYWLDQAAGNPDDWWYPGATFYGTDCYNGLTSRYRGAEEMFASAAKVARARGVPWLVPEYGIERITGDSGAGRAQAMREHIAWIRQQPDCLAVGWWNRGGNRITGLEPEQTVWREILAG